MTQTEKWNEVRSVLGALGGRIIAAVLFLGIASVSVGLDFWFFGVEPFRSYQAQVWQTLGLYATGSLVGVLARLLLPTISYLVVEAALFVLPFGAGYVLLRLISSTDGASLSVDYP